MGKIIKKGSYITNGKYDWRVIDVLLCQGRAHYPFVGDSENLQYKDYFQVLEWIPDCMCTNENICFVVENLYGGPPGFIIGKDNLKKAKRVYKHDWEKAMDIIKQNVLCKIDKHEVEMQRSLSKSKAFCDFYNMKVSEILDKYE